MIGICCFASSEPEAKSENESSTSSPRGRVPAVAPYILDRMRNRANEHDSRPWPRTGPEPLLALGADVVPHLIPILEADEPGSAILIRALDRLGPRASEAVETLARFAARRTSDPLGGEAVRALGSIGAESADAIPTLVQLATRVSWRRSLARAFGEIGDGRERVVEGTERDGLDRRARERRS